MQMNVGIEMTILFNKIAMDMMLHIIIKHKCIVNNNKSFNC